MTESLLIVVVIQLVVVIGLVLFLFRKKVEIDFSPVQILGQSVQQSYERTERTVRNELSLSRNEASTAAQQSREELGSTLKWINETQQQQYEGLGKWLNQWLRSIQDDSSKNLNQLRQESAINAKALREEVGKSVNGFNDSIVITMKELGSSQRTQLGGVVEQLAKLTESNEKKLDAIREESTKQLDQVRVETGESSKQLREEVGKSLKGFNDSIVNTINEMGSSQRTQLGGVVEQLAKLTESNEKKLDAIREESTKQLDQVRVETGESSKQSREEVGKNLKEFNESVSKQLEKMTDSNQQKLDALKLAVEEKLKGIQEDNAKQLDQMRATVDEKLQGTLEKRLGESFKLVSERLEQVHNGLGEMRQLATGVGDLKKVLTNVKSRGIFGEVQLGALLEQVLTPEQYGTNVDTRGTGERVEFAIKFPGRGENKEEIVWLPIDAKFPIEDYQRLIESQEKADLEATEIATKKLEARVKECAQTISRKYLSPPKTTDFAILFLPTEGLFAEVVRRIGLTELIQREYQVVIAGPTTLFSILNSFQMGFRTLAIQQRSSEVWKLLSAVKTEFSKYGDVLSKVQKQLETATKTIDGAAVRTRAITKKLRDVEELPATTATAVLMPEESFGDESQTEPEVADNKQDSTIIGAFSEL